MYFTVTFRKVQSRARREFILQNNSVKCTLSTIIIIKQKEERPVLSSAKTAGTHPEP